MTTKRAFDVLFALCALLTLSPLLIVIACWVKLDTPGPIFFKQLRTGRNGKPFHIYKFRSMRSDAQGLQLTVGADTRVTRAGAFIRRSKIDELPQFFNVIIGDMSVVGPRPEVPSYVSHYPAEVAAIVLSVRPGITDIASIAFRDESALLAQSTDPEQTYLRQILPIKLNFAQQYVQTRTFWMDLKIVVWTVLAILGLHTPYSAGHADKS